MKTVTLKPKEQPAVGLDADTITPDAFAGKSLDEISALEVYCGNRVSKLGDFFTVSGEAGESAEETRIVIDRSVPKTKRVGEGMRGGEIVIKGDVDMYVGAGMRGGKIVVEGNADTFAGLRMRGGELVIKGDCGDCLGAAYRGDWRGMRGGSILVHGSAGNEIGAFMRGGKITVKGDVGTFAGVHMRKGLIVIEGNAEGRVGGEMKGGTIIVKKGTEKLLPGFSLEGEKRDIEIDGESFKGKFLKFSGDHAEAGAKGVVYAAKEFNSA